MLALRGVPGIYFHSMFGSRSWKEGAERTGRYRSINREKLKLDDLEVELSNAQSLRRHVYRGFCQLLEARKAHTAFHPFGKQEILSIHPSIFALLRISPKGDEQLLCLQNVSAEGLAISIDLNQFLFRHNDGVFDIIGKKHFPISLKKLDLQLKAYEVLWLG